MALQGKNLISSLFNVCKRPRIRLRRCFSTSVWRPLKLDPPDIEIDWYLDDNNLKNVAHNLSIRKIPGDIEGIKLLAEKLKFSRKSNSDDACLRDEFLEKISKLPNSVHESSSPSENTVIETVGKKPVFDFKPLQLDDLGRKLDCLRKDTVTLSGPQSYHFTNCLVELEEALISFVLHRLVEEYGFELVSVPNLLSADIIEACGMDTKGVRNQIYKIQRPNNETEICLSGTSEMALAGMYANQTLNNDLPRRLVSVSRCFRAETSNLKKEKGIYRVHEFTKVEMFAVTTNETGDESEKMLEEFRLIQMGLTSDIGLHYKVLDMALHELGRPAHRKYDVEAWMPGRQMYGEISSASNCTDYQSRRLHVKYRDGEGKTRYVHTVNGTACAIPRMLICVMETYQRPDGTVTVPDVLRPYVKKDEFCEPNRKITGLRIKS